MIEYEQAVVRLGLEKTKVEGEVEQKKKSLKQVSAAYDLVRSVFLSNWEKLTEAEKEEAGKRIDVLSAFERQVEEEESNLKNLVLKQREVQESTEKKEQEIIVLETLFNNVNNKRIKLEESIVGLVKEKAKKEKEKNSVAVSLEYEKQEKEKISKKFFTLSASKVLKEREIENANKELKELNEIISILRISNKQGLDLVASFEGERKRLQAKEEFLIRKEKDLAKYEERVEKMRKDIGNNNQMLSVRQSK